MYIVIGIGWYIPPSHPASLSMLDQYCCFANSNVYCSPASDVQSAELGVIVLSVLGMTSQWWRRDHVITPTEKTVHGQDDVLVELRKGKDG